MRPFKSKLFLFIFRAVAVAAALCLLCAFDNITLTALEKLTLQSIKTFLPDSGLIFKSTDRGTSVTEKVSEEKPSAEKTTDVSKSILQEGLSDDGDIALLSEKALTESGDDEKGGEIYEYTFINDGVTDVFGSVKVKNVNETQIDIETLLKRKADLSVKEGQPTVLLYHTHTTETYQLLDRGFYAVDFKARTNDSGQNMIRVGLAIKQELENAGFTVIHDTAIYDNPYSGAYYRSEEAVKAYLEKYPSIDVTLDIHRDAIESDEGVKTKPVTVIDGKKAAQIMIISGCQEEGNGITDLPDWEQNLIFALQLQNKAESMFPSLMRPLYFCPRSYNMGLTHCSLLLEMGSDSNTLAEAVYSGRLIGKALAELLKEYEA